MPQVEVTRYIDGPRQRVWDTYTDHARFWSFMGPARIEREGSPDPNGTGCIRVLGPDIGAAREEILSFEAPSRLTYTVLPGRLPLKDHLGEVVLEDEGQGTRITWRARFASRIPGLGPVFYFIVVRVFNRAVAHLEEQFANSNAASQKEQTES